MIGRSGPKGGVGVGGARTRLRAQPFTVHPRHCGGVALQVVPYPSDPLAEGEVLCHVDYGSVDASNRCERDRGVTRNGVATVVCEGWVLSFFFRRAVSSGYGRSGAARLHACANQGHRLPWGATCAPDTHAAGAGADTSRDPTSWANGRIWIADNFAETAKKEGMEFFLSFATGNTNPMLTYAAVMTVLESNAEGYKKGDTVVGGTVMQESVQEAATRHPGG